MVTTYTRPTSTKAVEVHTACALFPMIGDDEFAALKADIAEHGQREPILLVDGEVIDGRNRMRACTELGIDPKVRNLSKAEAGDVFALVLSLNLHRRHLTQVQRGGIIKAELARRGGGAEKNKGGRPSKEPGDSRPVSITGLAKEFGIAKRTAVDAVKAHDAYAAATPEQKAAIDAGEMTPKQAAKQTAKREASPAAKDPDDDPRAHLTHKFNQWRDWLHKFLEENPRLRTRAQALLQSFSKEAQEDVNHE